MAFHDFLAAIQAATYNEYVDKPTTRVRDARAFEEMRQFLLQRYTGIHVVATVHVGEQVFDCVVDSIALPGHVIAPAPPATTGCPEGAIPMRRLTLEALTRFASLSAFLAKAPEPHEPPPT
jgi:hypothetical protein